MVASCSSGVADDRQRESSATREHSHTQPCYRGSLSLAKGELGGAMTTHGVAQLYSAPIPGLQAAQVVPALDHITWDAFFSVWTDDTVSSIDEAVAVALGILA